MLVDQANALRFFEIAELVTAWPLAALSAGAGGVAPKAQTRYQVGA
jgi:hypothetical protein